MLAMVDDDKESLKRQIEEQHPEWRQVRAMPKPIASVLKAMMEPEAATVEDYGLDPWWIMRVQANQYRSAQESLKREGFESYGPAYKVLGPLPLRMIPPKKRSMASLYKREVRRRRFDGYLFIRRMFGVFDVNRLFDLRGCGSLVTNASSIALVADFEIEMMRLAEADGSFDEVQVDVYRGYKVSRMVGDQWMGKSRIVGRVDESHKTVLFVERMGRIARLISSADPG